MIDGDGEANDKADQIEFYWCPRGNHMVTIHQSHGSVKKIPYIFYGTPKPYLAFVLITAYSRIHVSV